MSLPERRIDIPLVRGIDQSQDRRLAEPGTLYEAENLRFLKRGRLGVRYGMDKLTFSDVGGSAITSRVKRIAATQNELLALTETNLYSYASKIDRFADRSTHPRCSDITARGIARYSSASGMHGCVAESTNFRCVAWTQLGANGSNIVYAALYDINTGAMLWQQRVSGSDGGRFPRVLKVGNYFCIFFVWTAAGPVNTLRVRRIDISTTPTGLEATTTNLRTLDPAKSDLSSIPYDVDTDGTYVYAACNDTGAATIVVVKWNTSWAVQATQTAALVPNVVAIRVAGADVWVGASDLTPKTVYYRAPTSLASISAAFTLDAAKGAKPIVIREHPTTANTALFLLGLGVVTAAPVITIRYTEFLTGTTTGTVTTLTNARLYHWHPACKPFLDGQTNHAHCVFASKSTTAQAVYAVADLRTDVNGNGTDTVQVSAEGYFAVGAASQNHYNAPFPQAAISSTVAVGGGVVVALDEDWLVEDQHLNIGRSWVVLREWNYTSGKRWLHAPATDLATFSGGAPFAYDGSMCAEMGFPYSVDGNGQGWNSQDQVAGSLVNVGTYQWAFVYEWYDSKGYRHLSQPTFTYPITLAAGKNGEQFRVQTCTLTRKQQPFGTSGAATASPIGQPIRILVYRTVNNGSVFYLVDSLVVENDISVEAILFSDTASDASITTQEILYTQGGVVPNSFTGTLACITQHKQRLFGATGSRIYYTKLLKQFVAPEWPSTFVMDLGTAEPITAVASLDDSLVVFTASQTFVIQGDGPDDEQRGEFLPPFKLASDVGCVDPRSVVQFRDGLMFQSAVGLEILPRGGGAPEPVGLRVDDTVSANGWTFPSSAVVEPAQNQVRITVMDDPDVPDTGITLVWDYLYHEWTTYRAPNGVAVSDAVFFGGRYYAAHGSAAEVWKETNTHSDFAGTVFIPTTLTMQDVRLAGLSGEQHPWTSVLLGQFVGACALTWTLSYDGGVSFAGPGAVQVKSPDFSDEFALAHEHRNQRVASVCHKFVTAQGASPATAESGQVIYNAVSMLYGVEQGLRRLPETKRI